ncbi:hypothetical protein D3C73_1371370 [compost metagenome]
MTRVPKNGGATTGTRSSRASATATASPRKPLAARARHAAGSAGIIRIEIIRIEIIRIGIIRCAKGRDGRIVPGPAAPANPRTASQRQGSKGRAVRTARTKALPKPRTARRITHRIITRSRPHNSLPI